MRKVCSDIGFTSADVGLDADKCKVLVHIEEQSPDIGQGVHGMGTKTLEEIGAGDQGHMFGYATDETPELMPLTHVLATQLGYKLTEARLRGCGAEVALLVRPPGPAAHVGQRPRPQVRKNGTCPWLRPDGKTQVTVEYKRDGNVISPVRVHTILISTQHNPDVTNEKIRADIMEHVIKAVVPAKYLDDKTIYHINPSGRFVIGGPHGDAGLTGRKIIIDTYGGWGAHGGGAFSGKDPTKVDRSGAYIARQAAKSVVAAGLAKRALVQVSYAIGVPEPLSVHVDTYGTGSVPDKDILVAIKKAFDFRRGRGWTRRAETRPHHRDPATVALCWRRDPSAAAPPPPQARPHRPRPGPQAPPVPEDGGVRSLWPRRPRLHVGEGPRPQRLRPGTRSSADAGPSRPRLRTC